jgi:hypothetical protein
VIQVRKHERKLIFEINSHELISKSGHRKIIQYVTSRFKEMKWPCYRFV